MLGGKTFGGGGISARRGFEVGSSCAGSGGFGRGIGFILTGEI